LGVATDESGNIYTTGAFQGTVDFDPGAGVDIHTSTLNSHDAFICKYDSSGNFEWARTWDAGYCQGIDVDTSGNLYVIGGFGGTVDFDPGTGSDSHTSVGDEDAYLSKFDSNGNFIWARTWGGSDWESGLGVSIDGAGNVLVTGGFRGTADFDPGSGVDNHISSVQGDTFLSKFDSDGNFTWARTWGGYDNTSGISADGWDSIYVTGMFYGTVDFDPGSGVDDHTSNVGPDAFLSKFDANGDFLWARTWGGSGADTGSGVDVDTSGNAFVTGHFENEVDFDPGSPVDNHTSNGQFDSYLSKFDSNGNFEWAKTWGALTGIQERALP
jgi:hypothetical protein